MPAALFPPDEEARQAVLQSCRVMDTPPDDAFDALTRRAKELCGVPMATITLVDGTRQWFKSKIGVAASENPRGDSLCAHALLTPGQALVIPDTTQDARVVDNPLVTGEPHLRFYAGVPLLSNEGLPLGTLCVLDQVPRELSDAQLEQLGNLAQQASYQLAQRRRTSAERRLALGFGLTLALFLVTLGSCFWQANRFLASDWWVSHTKEVIGEINEVLAGVQTAESSQRGFSATGQEDFATASQQAMDRVPERLAALRTLVGDNQDQVAHCDQLATLIARRVDVMREHIAERRELGLAALDAVHMNDRGRRAMAEVLAKGHEMIDAENVLFQARSRRRMGDLHVAGGTLLGAGALCVGMLCAGFVLNRRELRRRQALGASLVQANAGLKAEVAERRRAFISLRESEARFRRIADNVPGMVYRFVRRANGIYSLPFVSRGCRKIYGLGPEEIQQDAQVLTACIHPDDRAEHDRTVAASAASLAPWSWQGRIVRPGDGQTRWVQGTSQPERQPDGDILWDGVLMDVTERREAEHHRQALEEAERSNREKSRFLSRVSHELRTPLNSILGFGQLLQTSNLCGQDAEALDFILRSGKHLLGLVDEVLDFSTAESGELRLVLSQVDVTGLVQECLQMMACLAAERRITCHVEGFVQPVMLVSDEKRLRQILLNLLSNAVKYNREGGSVWVRGRAVEGGRLRVEVTDGGAGIAPEDLARLFVPFTRLETNDKAIKGVGLGLVVSRRLAEALGGTLGLESTVGVGSTCWLELPLGEESDIKSSATQPPELELDESLLNSLAFQ